eukprot:TRINITY_DN1847_c0_g1_i1.p1 TRINITY_DN1847_c0_g1~~TRINITY_DN1847_c0_g1_i1.p1  ORF type:complete len:126 (+),score=29.31 TRINITY_DN1847_c0_g1_i1:24-380(+)
MGSEFSFFQYPDSNYSPNYNPNYNNSPLYGNTSNNYYNNRYYDSPNNFRRSINHQNVTKNPGSIKNQDNRCFLNALLQVLFRFNPFRKAFLDCNTENESFKILIEKFQVYILLNYQFY